VQRISRQLQRGLRDEQTCLAVRSALPAPAGRAHQQVHGEVRLAICRDRLGQLDQVPDTLGVLGAVGPDVLLEQREPGPFGQVQACPVDGSGEPVDQRGPAEFPRQLRGPQQPAVAGPRIDAEFHGAFQRGDRHADRGSLIGPGCRFVQFGRHVLVRPGGGPGPVPGPPVGVGHDRRESLMGGGDLLQAGPVLDGRTDQRMPEPQARRPAIDQPGGDGWRHGSGGDRRAAHRGGGVQRLAQGKRVSERHAEDLAACRGGEPRRDGIQQLAGRFRAEPLEPQFRKPASSNGTG